MNKKTKVLIAFLFSLIFLMSFTIAEETEAEDSEYADVCTFDNLSFDFRLPSKVSDINTIKDFDLRIT